MSDLKIKYVKHPVSKAEKIKLRKAGFTIVDARFDPNPKAEPVAAPVVDPPELDDIKL